MASERSTRKRIARNPQPPKQDVKEFYRDANPLLEFKPFWIDPAKRQAIADAFCEVIKRCGYTCWACANMWNHAHLLIRRHRDDALTMWDEFAAASREAPRAFDDVGAEHPVWSDRPYKVFCFTPDDVRGRITYIKENPEKERLPPQPFEFVLTYDDWPFHNRRN